MGKRKLSQTAHNVNPAQKRWKKDFDHKKAKGKKGAAPAVHAKGQQQQKPRQLPTAFQKKKEKEALKFESESDEDEELTGEEMEDESESDEGEVLQQTKAINKKGAAPAVQAKAQQPQKKGQLVTAVQTKKAKETLKFETESDEDEELTDEEMEDESDSDEGEVLPQTKANNKKSAAPAMQAKAQQPQKKGQLVTAVQTKKTKETLKFESESDEDEELTDEEMEDESDSDEGEVLPQTKAKDKKVAPVVAKAQLPQKQNQLATAVQKKKEKEALKFESESDEDEELTDEEMEDEDESDEGEVLQQTKDKKGAAPVVQAKAQQQQKQRDAAAATNGSAKKEGLSHQSAKFKAIVAEEDRRRAERDKVTIFLRCEALQKMTEHEIKSLHPDTLSVRTNNKGYCWLLFASEPTAEKALAALSKKTAISGKELYVDRCGAKAQSKSEKLKKGKALDQPINPTELIISNFPLATTTEQLKVIFPTAKSVRLVTLNAKKNNFRRATRALIDFGNEADAKKAFDKGAQIKVGGAPVDLYFARV